ncbi:MAG: STAS domain-containing protein [Desulfobacterales bacterium]|nr:STAS domain-containing protein [Desulfobacterales bacterium]MDD4070871.1 STAS domain-containing protein [Desulfobacterales bacterium]MDD4392878.1 STAS domain-containing protein [Desulfobacterales bacterium]
MKLIEQQYNRYRIFKIAGRLDSNTSPEFEKKILDAARSTSDFIILDFKELNYISSAGLRVILKTAKEIEPSERELYICGMEDYVKEVFEISGFDTFLNIVPTLEDALKVH